MNSIHEYYYAQVPMVKIIGPFIIGICLADYTSKEKFIWVAIIIFFSLIAFISVLKLTSNYKNLRIQSKWKRLLILLLFFVLGFLNTTLKDKVPNNHFQSIDTQDAKKYLLIVKKEKESAAYLNYQTEVIGVVSNHKRYKTSGKIIVHCSKIGLSSLFSVGDTLITNSNSYEIKEAVNPQVFNYAELLFSRGMKHEIYLKRSQFTLRSNTKTRNWQTIIEKCRNSLTDLLLRSIPHKREQGFVIAILLGNKNYLLPENKQSFIDAGAMHILAVSGLHVGIIFLIAYSLVSLLFKPPNYKIYRAGLLLVAIWLYAVITGGSPSVLRASTMFSFIIIGKEISRNNNIYNSLAASAFLLLLLQPNLIKSVGFQLSYSAVLGIVFLQSKIYSLIHCKYYFLDKLWELTTVSLAAQLATLPISIYYFNVFPNYFWLSNLFVIPAALIIVPIGILLIVFSWSNFLSVTIGSSLCFIVNLLNELVLWMSKLPFSVTSNLYINKFQLIVLIASLLLMLLSVIYKQKQVLLYSLLLTLILVLSINLTWINKNNQHQLIIYNLRGKSVFDIIIPKHLHTSYDYDFMYSLDYNYKVFPMHKFSGINNRLVVNTDSLLVNQNKLFKHPEFNLFHWVSPIDKIPIIPDYTIISKHINSMQLRRHLPTLKKSKIVLDSSFPPSKVEVWKRECKALDLDCYFVTDNKAFQADLKQ